MIKSPDELNAAVAELVGWTRGWANVGPNHTPISGWWSPTIHGVFHRGNGSIPLYSSELSAVYLAEEYLIAKYGHEAQLWVRYSELLNELALRDRLPAVIQGLPFHAPAYHRCEALLQLFNKL